MPEYYLHVELIVRAENRDVFETAMGEFLEAGAFSRFDDDDVKFGMKMVLALRTEESFEYSAYSKFQSVKGQFETKDSRGPFQAYRYVHLWRLNNATDLDIAKIMTRSADDDLYNEVDRLVAIESQNVVSRVQFLAGQPAMPVGKKFLRVQRQFKSGGLGAYLFKVGALFPTLSEGGFQTLGHFQNVTGAINTVVEFWDTNPDHSEKLDDMLKALANVPKGFTDRIVSGFRDLPQAETRESLIRTSYFDKAKKA